MKPIGHALRLFRQNRSLWSYAVVPVIGALILFIAVYMLGLLIAVPLFGSLTERWGWGDMVGQFGGAVLVTVVYVLAAGAIVVTLAGLLSGLLWDPLSKRAEITEFGEAPEAELPVGQRIFDTLVRLVFGGFIALLTLILGWAFFGVVGVLLTGTLGLIEYTSPAMARRGFLMPKQPSVAFKLKGWPGFLLIAGIVSIVPLLNVLAMPILVVAATILVRTSEGAPN
jgi:uncharacterized protein involved in cysteine biosynthesis